MTTYVAEGVLCSWGCGLFVIDAYNLKEEKEKIRNLDEDKFAKLIELEEIRKNDYNLNIMRYVDTSVEEEEINIEEVISRISEREQELAESKEKLNSFLEQLGFERI